MIRWRKALASNTYEITGFPTHRPRRLSEHSISEKEQSHLQPADRVIRRPSPSVSTSSSSSSAYSSPATDASDILVTPKISRMSFKMSVSFLIGAEDSFSSGSASEVDIKKSEFGHAHAQASRSPVFSRRFGDTIPNKVSRKKEKSKARKARFYDAEYYDSDEDKENIAPIIYYY